ncbi:ribonuclease Z [Paenibacillus sp. NPDC058071]|uniref:ribonuclease Z n=1 Tax=Paenibacillus sp. NPDC058071 TaxID=3346326 RepID=UPI0036DC4E47
MELWFLGTGAGRPMKERNVTSIAMKLPEPDCGLWMFDAGEATQHQLMRTPLKMSKLSVLFVTHMHGDHTFGIPGLLSTRSYVGGNGPLKVIGPSGIREMIETAMRLSGTHIDYEISYVEIAEDGVVYEDERFTVEAGKLEHRVPCYGYRVMEKEQPGKLDVGLLQRLGVAAGPLYGKLKRGEDITLPDGSMLRGSDVTGQPLPGRIVTVLGDTRPCEGTVRLARDADLLVHEATFGAGQEEKAHLYGHSTTMEAAAAAREAGARRLVMTHFSSRFTADDLPQLEQEAQSVFPESTAAFDLYHTTVSRRQTQ